MKLRLKIATVCFALFLSARLSMADTISIQGLNGPAPSGALFQWSYNAFLSASGEIQAGDYVEVDSIPGFANLNNNAFSEVGFDGTRWDITHDFANSEVEAVYTGNMGTVVGPVTSSVLIQLPFLDYSGIAGGSAEWGSDDHAAVGALIGQAETPVSGQFVDAPMAVNFAAVGVPEIDHGGLASLAILLAGAFALMEGFRPNTRAV